jgi:site-specific recombinase XerD
LTACGGWAMVKATRRTTSKTAERWRKGVDDLTLADLASFFEFHNRTEGKSPNTIKWYNEVLGRFERFLRAEQLSLLIRDIGEPEVRAFIDHLQHKVKWSEQGRSGEHLSGSGIQNRVRGLKAFFAWLAREGYTETNRLEKLRNFKVEQKLKDILDEAEIGQVLGALDVKTPWGARDHAILVLMLDSGLRLSEVVGLKDKDLDVEVGALKVLGKGNKERIVPFGAAAQKTLWRYRHHYRPDSRRSDRFFLTLEGATMTQSGLISLFKRLHPHLCRHTFATRYLIHGGDVFSLQQILGHTTLDMVRKYVQLANAHVAVQHRKFSPMDHVETERRHRTDGQKMHGTRAPALRRMPHVSSRGKRAG